MAVYKRSYHQYDGPVTPLWSRFLILPRYAFKNVFRSRLLLAFYILCFFPVLFAGAYIYVSHNVNFLQLVGLDARDFLAINANVANGFLVYQFSATFILTVFVGPGLVSPDMADNALPLYLCRPFSRAEYALGKMSVLFILISSLTWIPTLLLTVMQTAYAGMGWLTANLRIPLAMLASSWMWMIVISLLAVSFSAWFRWRVLAGAMLFVVFAIPLLFGLSINGILSTYWGTMVDLFQVMGIIMSYLLHGEAPRGTIPVWAACLSLAGYCAVCLHLLNRRLRAYEVVR